MLHIQTRGPLAKGLYCLLEWWSVLPIRPTRQHNFKSSRAVNFALLRVTPVCFFPLQLPARASCDTTHSESLRRSLSQKLLDQLLAVLKPHPGALAQSGRQPAPHCTDSTLHAQRSRRNALSHRSANASSHCRLLRPHSLERVTQE